MEINIFLKNVCTSACTCRDTGGFPVETRGNANSPFATADSQTFSLRCSAERERRFSLGFPSVSIGASVTAFEYRSLEYRRWRKRRGFNLSARFSRARFKIPFSGNAAARSSIAHYCAKYRRLHALTRIRKLAIASSQLCVTLRNRAGASRAEERHQEDRRSRDISCQHTARSLRDISNSQSNPTVSLCMLMYSSVDQRD